MIVGFDWQLEYKQMQFIRHCISWKHVYIYSNNLQTKWNTHQHTQHIIPLTNLHMIRLVHFYVATLNMHYNSPYLSTANQGIKVLHLLSYRHDMGMPIMQFRRSPDRSIFVMETSIHIRPVFILVQHPVYGAYVKTVMRTSITKLEQSWDRLKFIIGIPIKKQYLLWMWSQMTVISKIRFYRHNLAFGRYQLEMFLLLQVWAQMRPSTLKFCYNLKKITSKWYKTQLNQDFTDVFARNLRLIFVHILTKLYCLGCHLHFPWEQNL